MKKYKEVIKQLIDYDFDATDFPDDLEKTYDPKKEYKQCVKNEKNLIKKFINSILFDRKLKKWCDWMEHNYCKVSSDRGCPDFNNYSNSN